MKTIFFSITGPAQNTRASFSPPRRIHTAVNPSIRGIRHDFHDTGSVVVYFYNGVVKSNNLWDSFTGRGMSGFFSNQMPAIVEKSFNGPGPVFRKAVSHRMAEHPPD